MLQPVWGGNGSHSGSVLHWILMAVQGQRQDYGLAQKRHICLTPKLLKGISESLDYKAVT